MQTCPLSRRDVFRVPVWDSASASRSDGLWEAAAAGRASGEAAEIVELHSKTAVWSPTTKSFELDVMEVRARTHGAQTSFFTRTDVIFTPRELVV